MNKIPSGLKKCKKCGWYHAKGDTCPFKRFITKEEWLFIAEAIDLVFARAQARCNKYLKGTTNRKDER